MASFRRSAEKRMKDNPKAFQKTTPKKAAAPKKKATKAPLKSRATKVAKPSASRSRKSSQGYRPGKVLTWTAIAAIIPVFALMGAPVGLVAAWIHSHESMVEFEAYNPPEATLIKDNTGRHLAALYEQRRYVSKYEDFPALMPMAFVSIEDERYFQHFGVDFRGIARAAIMNIVRGRLSQGASTITQQTARNLLTDIGSEKTASRKLREMLTAFRMEHLYSKDQILEVYLNQIYLGSGSYGVEAASRTYFGKSVNDLELPEVALMAGLPQLPERYSPLNNMDKAKRRRDQVLFKMLENGVITDREYADAVTEEIALNPEKVSRSAAPYFMDAIRRELADHPELGGDRLQRAGWEIQATINPLAQAIAEEVLKSGLAREENEWLALRNERYRSELSKPGAFDPPQNGEICMGKVIRFYENSIVVQLPSGHRADLTIPEGSAHFFEKGVSLNVGEGVDILVEETNENSIIFKGKLLPETRLQGALVCLDSQSGEVRALVGGRDYYDRENNGFFHRALMARRQAGSTIKPFFFASALAHGIRPTKILMDTKIIFNDGYTPRNYDNRYVGPVTMQRALEKSRNVPTIALVRETGLKDAIEYVHLFNRTDGEQSWDLPLEWPVVLGSTGVTPFELAVAYQPFANAGLSTGASLLDSVRNSDNRESVRIESTDPLQITDSATAAYMLQMLTGVMHNGTGHSLIEGMPLSLRHRVAGKSGTTNDNRDAWFAGFTPHDVVVVWVGFDQNIPLGPGRTGSKAAGPIWADYMTELWGTKSDVEKRAPFRISEEYMLVCLDDETGSLIGTLESNDSALPETGYNWRVLTKQDYRQRYLQRDRASEDRLLNSGDYLTQRVDSY